MQIAGQIRGYFGSDAEGAVVDSEFTPGFGWVSARQPIPATIETLRKLRRTGTTAVAVRLGDRVADFDVDEVLKYADRPLLGGRLV
jgi:hypothetical protein